MALKRVWILLFTTFCLYSFWIYTYDTNVPVIYHDASVAKGWEVWQNKNCQSCHQLYGLGVYMGPDLTNTASDSRKGEKYMFTLIKYGTGKMPDFKLSDAEVNNVISFLSWVDKSGRSKVAEESVHWTGTYIIEK